MGGRNLNAIVVIQTLLQDGRLHTSRQRQRGHLGEPPLVVGHERLDTGQRGHFAPSKAHEFVAFLTDRGPVALALIVDRGGH